MKETNKTAFNKFLNFSLRLLVALLFVCIGIQGVAGEGDNDLFRAIGTDWACILLGVVLICSGLLVIVPSFIKGINKSFTVWSLWIICAVWTLVIIFTDFVYGFDTIRSAMSFFSWLENLIYHLLILFAIIKATKVPQVKIKVQTK